MAFNMDPKKCPMPTQDPNVRNKNFKEVALGYECGVTLEKFADVKEGDVFEAYVLEEYRD